MNLKEKIFLSITFAISGIILMNMMDEINNELRRKLEKSNPKLVENVEWFFGDEKKKTVKVLILLGLACFIIAIWLDQVVL